MDEAKIRQIVQQEIAQHNSGARFGLNPIQRHVHNGVDSPQVREADLVQSPTFFGAITFSSKTTYTLNINSSVTPSNILCYGNVTGNAGERYFFFGSATLTPSFFFQPLTNTSVTTNTLQYPLYDKNILNTTPAQSCTYFGATAVDGTGAMHTLAGEGHIINIFYSTVHARATITEFSKNKVLLEVTDLDAGWAINANFVIT